LAIFRQNFTPLDRKGGVFLEILRRKTGKRAKIGQKWGQKWGQKKGVKPAILRAGFQTLKNVKI
jgi:hypothetical protein